MALTEDHKSAFCFPRDVTGFTEFLRCSYFFFYSESPSAQIKIIYDNSET